MRRSWIVLVLGWAGCFDSPTALVGADGSTSHGESASDEQGETAGSNDDGGSDAMSDTDGSPSCGDGRTDPGEICDDGTNDGSYGGCMPGCGALGPHCGDGIVDGDIEACDDGGRGQCLEDCSAPSTCGDGIVDPNEACDEGRDNDNGSGCNVDCTASGSVVGAYDHPDVAFCADAIIHLTTPVFRANGHALFAVMQCDRSPLLLELSDAAEFVRDFGEVLPASTAVSAATMIGVDLLLATDACNYRIAPDGVATEACDDGRVTGWSALRGRADGSYLALDSESLAAYPPGSPTEDDAPTWFLSANAQDPPAIWSAVAWAPDGSLLVGGTHPSGNYLGHVARLSASGSPIDAATFDTLNWFSELHVSSTGWMGVVVDRDDEPRSRLMRLESDFSEGWTLGTDPVEYVRGAAIDSNDDVVVLGYTPDWANLVVAKVDAAGSMRWHTLLDVEAATSVDLAIGPDDRIWVAMISEGAESTLHVRTLAP